MTPPERDTDYLALQQEVARLHAIIKGLRETCGVAADLIEDLIDHDPREDAEAILARLHGECGLPKTIPHPTT